MGIAKNVTRTIPFSSLTTSLVANTALAPTCFVDKDGAGQVAATNAPVHQGNGSWKIVLTAAEMNADMIIMTAIGTGLMPFYQEIYTDSIYTATRAGYLDNLSAGAPALAGSAPSWYSPGAASPVPTSQSGHVLAGSTGSALLIQGFAGGKTFTGQLVYHYASGQSHTVTSQSEGAGFYTLNFTGGSNQFTSFGVGDSVSATPTS